MSAYDQDLVVLVPDKNTEAAMRGVLSRPPSLGVRPVQYELYVHPERDPGCLREAHNFLRSMISRCARALVLFDRVGSGGEKLTPQDLQRQVERNLAATGWGERAATIVLDPELEVWVWSDSPEVDRCLGWHGRQPALRDWLHEQGMWPPDLTKPPDPKQATEQALRQVRKPRSSAVYERLATKVSLRRCSDPAFLRLRQQLVEWFPFLPAGSSTEQ